MIYKDSNGYYIANTVTSKLKSQLSNIPILTLYSKGVNYRRRLIRFIDSLYLEVVLPDNVKG